ncbi:MAG: hypothetical protein ACOYMB_02260 [Patescibacteria group bacterium]
MSNLHEILKRSQDFQIKNGFNGSLIPVANPLWLSVSEATKIGGIQPKTIRRALKLKDDGSDKTVSGLKFKIIKNRYQIEFGSLLTYLYSNTKLRNKFTDNGLGQYVGIWKI